MGTFANGYYQTFLNYSLTNSDVFYSFQKINPETFSRKYPFYFNPTAQSFGDSGDFQYLHFSNGNNLKLFYTINPNNTGKVRECIGERIGYYDNSKYIKNGYEQDLDFFPLDPALKTTYYMHSSNYNN